MNTDIYKKIDLDRDKRMTWIKCLKCGDVIFSTYPNEFVQCSCKACYVDGDESYAKIGGNEGDFKILSMKEKEDLLESKIIEGSVDNANS